MKNYKSLEAAGLASIAAIFIGGSFIYLSLLQVMIDFILNLQVSGIYH
jgi:hypothetical protein